jgi:putative peptide zinc metalloprotease protein
MHNDDLSSYFEDLQNHPIVDTSEGRPVYLIAVGQKPTYLRLSSTSYFLLQKKSQGASFEEIARTMDGASPEKAKVAYEKVVLQIREIAQQSQASPSAHMLRLPFLSRSRVMKIATVCAPVFHIPVVCCSIVFIAASFTLFPRSVSTFHMNPDTLIWAYVLYLASVLMHELGHASACARFGANPGEIGFTFYLFWPALYSDVSDAWRLKRWQRVVVDVAGIFFQMWTAAIYLCAYSLTGHSSTLLSVTIILSACFFNLNPFFKFDGYWMCADALGVTNLHRSGNQILRHLLCVARRQPVQALPWPPRVVAIVAVYAALNLVFSGYFLLGFLKVFANTLLNYPKLMARLLTALATGTLNSEADNFLSFSGSTLMVIIGSLMIAQMIKYSAYIFSVAKKRV